MRGRLPSDLLVTSGCRDEARGREAVAGLAREGLHPRYHALDITDEAAITRLRDHLREQYGGIDVLVNNAGLCLPSNTELAFGEQARVTLGLNYYSNKVMSSLYSSPLYCHLHPSACVSSCSRCCGAAAAW